MTQFKDLGLSAPILKALVADGYATPTPIQAQAIPPVMAGRDLVGLAQTGTGKTAAFALPILHRLAENRRHAGPRGCRVLVLAPTRELAAQIGESFRSYGRFIGLSTAVVFGGASMVRQREALARGVDVLVATPGRLLDHVAQRTVTLQGVEILVLDEADHMLDMGFIHALRRIAQLLPARRQTLFFSATMPAPIAELAATFLTDPVQVAVTPVSSTAERVEQAVIHVEQARKVELLDALLDDDRSITRTIVFTRTKHGADKVVKKLEGLGHEAEAIHGNKSQGQRERALAAFKAGKVRVLVATEIAARGIDVDDVSHVINFDLPNVPEQYVHRIGRTARAGAGGRAISFCAPDERAYLRDIERLTKQPVEVLVHELGLAPPARLAEGQGQRAPQGQRKPQGPKQADRRGQEPHGQRGRQGQSARPGRKPDQQRSEAGGGDPGDRRDRKGRDVWSNAPQAPARAKPRTRRP